MLFGLGVEATSFMPRGALYWNDTLEGFPYDLAKAQEEMAQSATPDGFPLALTILAGSADDEALGTALKDMWSQIGVEVTAFQTDAEEFAGISTGRVDAILEDDVKVLEYLGANKSAPIEIVPNVAVPDELIFKYGYGYARFALRKEDCSLRAAYTQALAEIRGNGNVSYILKKYGLSNRNLFFFPL